MICSNSKGLRRVPRQARSRARVEAAIHALLDLVSTDGIDPSHVTTSDVAERAGIPIGSLYEYFEDLGCIVDAAVSQSLRSHEELVSTSFPRQLTTTHELVDVFIESFTQLYEIDPRMLALRTSTLFQPHHRDWMRDYLEAYVKSVAVPGTELATFAERRDVMKRLGLFVAVSETVMQHAYADGAVDDEDVAEECRDILRSTMEHVTR
ncbi:MAG: TetR/AcrR family transcriptional regulator [Ilumatobacteraceae bacterium]